MRLRLCRKSSWWTTALSPGPSTHAWSLLIGPRTSSWQKSFTLAAGFRALQRSKWTLRFKSNRRHDRKTNSPTNYATAKMAVSWLGKLSSSGSGYPQHRITPTWSHQTYPKITSSLRSSASLQQNKATWAVVCQTLDNFSKLRAPLRAKSKRCTLIKCNKKKSARSISLPSTQFHQTR